MSIYSNETSLQRFLPLILKAKENISKYYGICVYVSVRHHQSSYIHSLCHTKVPLVPFIIIMGHKAMTICKLRMRMTSEASTS